MLSILRYAEEVRPAEPYFEKIEAEPAPEAVRLATELVKAQSGEFAPETMPNEFARAVQELVQAKLEERAPEVEVTAEGKPLPTVVDIMAVLKQSVQSNAEPRAVVRKRAANKSGSGKAATPSSQSRSRPGQRRSVQ